jgi:ribosome-binding ATPase YchF (GTP1/OBG family)
MSLEAGIVGLPGSGKTTLFNALTQAHAGRDYGKEHVGVAQIADERLEPLRQIVGSAAATPAVLRVLDVPGTGAAHLNNLRRADALLALVDAFSPNADPPRDRETLELELVMADRDHVERRLERVRRQAKSGDPSLRREAEELERVLVHAESGRSLREYTGGLPPELDPLTTKPLVWIENGPGGIDAKLEEELAELPEDEAAEFREGLPALAEVVRRLFEALALVTFFTANENEAHAWTLRSGQTALDAAATVHTDMARGFIRCEVIRWRDLVDCGSRAEAAHRGLQRLEGKTYVVQDGDVLNVRFHVWADGPVL